MKRYTIDWVACEESEDGKWVRYKNVAKLKNERDKLYEIASGLLTALNTGNIEKGSLLHLELRKVIMEIREFENKEVLC